ncbi:GGDEF domain-containing protein [Candidatus Sulfurimonas baltica]|uniref:diguanylate cyclase n=1 Tax=Candidatus Sulfurimonas baltica TaxID=2740404 RepID=A0A7S7RLJ3_9BACT|nr:GGDEF domain-containing protein [Candidatus Sulfurimonas baltica]QOY51207.1 GGDEF domain-containing protein [Candidatus Sulfurimonas baltica]
MLTHEEKLQIISNQTKNVISEIKIVTPTIYSNIFSKYASPYKIKLNNEEVMTDELLNERITLYTNLQKQATKNAHILSANAEKSISAILDKDEKTLEKILKDTKKLRKELKKLKVSIYVDQLTNIYSKKWLYDKFLKEDNKNFKEAGTLAIVDVNYFKTINDTYGHIIGDKVLKFIANKLKKLNEPVLRYERDVFIVIFSASTSKLSAVKQLNAIRENIIKKQIKADDASFKVSFSFGVIDFKEDDAIDKVIEKADKNMKQDKTEIKKRVPSI